MPSDGRTDGRPKMQRPPTEHKYCSKITSKPKLIFNVKMRANDAVSNLYYES